jgi:hypothetical protein
MATKLGLYNKAALHLGQRRLSALTDDVEFRYEMDNEYTDALDFCLRQGFWNFAMNAVSMDSDITPEFGYTYGFTKPTDWARTYVMSSNENFDPPLMDYQDQNAFWMADVDPIYVRYVSTTKGTDLGIFPVDYAEYVGAYLAWKVYKRVTGSGDETRAMFEKTVLKKALARAKGNDAIDQAPGSYPQGAWASSRGGWGGERGKRGQLIG